MTIIPDDFTDLFERPSHTVLVTVDPDGTPHPTVVWVDYDGEHLLVNTADGRRKVRNMRNDPTVALTVIDPENPYRYLTVRGKVIEITEDGAEEHINELGKRYMDIDDYMAEMGEGETRLVVRINPEEAIPVVAA
ncbi:PPOX class F420-dependent oxidoreductase [Natrinema gelatinilyticum]|uniref:PPOX class F420-dependent oxidoreductase n=1 Tax=Natrinema gelatinilyticum TaxID=2961571 RepID=UPI0020C3917C|nr:PPOX class F420-dependent oxidoreductase [Natrinema gelatinilyticum]